MPLDPEFVAETRSWLMKARGDLLAADLLRNANPALRGEALFHCQQGAEKAHNLGDLGQTVASLAAALAPLLRNGAGLTDYAWKYRYPGVVGDPTSGEAEEALTLARDIYEAILAQLPHEVRP